MRLNFNNMPMFGLQQLWPSPRSVLPVSQSSPTSECEPGDRPSGLAEDRVLDSRELLGGAVEVRIVHGAETYRLRLTRNGKLILQK